MKLIIPCLLLASSVCVAQMETPARTDRRANALEWIQKSAEYQVAARQAYSLAKIQLDQVLQQASFSADEVQAAAGNFEALPVAIILDVDETVLDNSEYNRRQMKIGAEYDSKSWAAWGKERSAIPVPGAVEFLDYAQSKGVDVFFVTNRKDELRNATFDNLVKVGISTTLDRVLTRNSDEGRGGDKISRRAIVAEKYRIALLIGDNFADLTAAARDDFKAAPQVSAGWVMLPNPVYGYWETRPEPSTPAPTAAVVYGTIETYRFSTCRPATIRCQPAPGCCCRKCRR